MNMGAAVVDRNYVYFVLKSSRDVYGYLLDDDKWYQYPKCPYYYTGLAMINNVLTAVGGSTSDPGVYSKNDSYQKTSTLLCLINMMWVQWFAPLNIARCDHAVINNDHCVIAAGGVDESSTEIFIIGSNTWSILSNKFPRVLHSINATLCDDYIYVMDRTGTLYKYSNPVHSILSSLATGTHREQSSQHTWRPLPRPPSVESTLSTMCGQLVVVGGRMNYECPVSVYIRQLYKEGWVTIGHMAMGRRDPIVAVVPENRMIVVGGRDLNFSVVELAVPC